MDRTYGGLTGLTIHLATYCVLSISHISYFRSDPAFQRPAVYRETNIPAKSTDLLRGSELGCMERMCGAGGDGQ